MVGKDIVLKLLIVIEFVNLVIRMTKIRPPREPELDDNILRTLYI